MLETILTDATCGEACWMAREDVCRCSCNGRNHGCLKTADGTRPQRTAKIDGVRYTLHAVGSQGEVHEQAYALNLADGTTFVYADSSRDYMFAGIAAKTRKASASQFERWEELTAEREAFQTAKSEPDTCYAAYGHLWPYLLWVRSDLAEKTEPVAA